VTPLRWTRHGWLEPRGATPGRMAAAARAVRREQERYALLGDEVEIETPEQRIERVDRSFVVRQQRGRDTKAAMWRRARRRLYSLPCEQREAVRRWWSDLTAHGMPAVAEYAADVLYAITTPDHPLYARWWRQIGYEAGEEPRLVPTWQRRRGAEQMELFEEVGA